TGGVGGALRALSRLASGKIALSGLAVTIEGLAPDKGTAVAVSYQLKRDLPALFSSSESIKWKEADFTGSAGMLLAPQSKDVDADSGAATAPHPRANLKAEQDGNYAEDPALVVGGEKRADRLDGFRLVQNRRVPLASHRERAQIWMAVHHRLDGLCAEQIRICSADHECGELTERRELWPEVRHRASE